MREENKRMQEFPENLKGKKNFYINKEGEIIQKVTIHLPLDLVDKLKREALDKRTTLSEIIRESLYRRLGKSMTKQQIMVELVRRARHSRQRARQTRRDYPSPLESSSKLYDISERFRDCFLCTSYAYMQNARLVKKEL